ncbi:spore germination protein [Bacillus badius]|uniref:Spore germination protein n=1 Tax=Bacillus badius TaxID=1455 RepID=A0ABR5AXL4_BACBA|nr:spore germination protein [Bacillus badius]KIL75949.1 Spore germination protein [Bacillus badius]KIL79491.1 Spore germination protein [Bacillus badius]MED4716656.1 spore germination protein [Bacillus badius]
MRRNKRSSSAFHSSEIGKLIDQCCKSADFVTFQLKDSPFFISYFQTLVDKKVLHRDILTILKDKQFISLEDMKHAIQVEDLVLTTELSSVKQKLMQGNIIIYQQEAQPSCLLIPAFLQENRQVSIPETEYSVVGPKEAFVESLDTNINLVRKRIPVPEFQIKEFSVGKLSKTRVAVAYIEGIADEENVNTVIQRITDIGYDQIIDSSFINQMIADNKNSPFPQLVDTERPDRVASVLMEGKVAILVDGSPSAITGPATLGEFFSAFEDYVTVWNIASAFRLIRFLAITFSVLSTPLYVAVLTYHYEMIPQDLLTTLISSRAGIPFPPLLEAIILEWTIELLREAGARLPTKVGQTIGIVGGIVIGTAAVQAGLTSNVLLIVVALSALASFTTPVYQVSNAIRLIRFPFLIFAQLLGLLGVAACTAIVVAHLLKLKSLGRPFLEPVYPIRLKDMKDALIRLPFNQQTSRPLQTRTDNKIKFRPHSSPPDKRDIDE